MEWMGCFGLGRMGGALGRSSPRPSSGVQRGEAGRPTAGHVAPASVGAGGCRTSMCGRSTPSCGRGGGGAPCTAAAAPRFHSTLSTAVAVVSRWAATSSSTACSAQARISTSSGESCSISSPASMRRRAGVELEHAVEPQHVRDEVVGEQRQPVEVPAGRDAGQLEVGGGDLGALEERDRLAVVGRDVGHVGQRRERARRARSAEPSAERASARKRPPSRPRRARRARSARARTAPSARARGPGRASRRSPAPSIARSSAAVHGPRGAQARLDRAEARQPGAACAGSGTSPSRS